MDEKPDMTVKVGGADIPAYLLDDLRKQEGLTLMPMTEGLTLIDDDNLLVLFESGAMKYSDGKFRTDRVWRMPR